MKWGCCLYLLACSITLLKAQGTADGCVTCAVGDFFKSSWEDWFLPAAGTLQFLVPDSTPAPETPIPKTDLDNQETNNLPGSVNQPDIELQTIVSPDKECNPNGAKSTSCAVATAQIIWPLPVPCGDEAQASRILDEINRLAPTGRVRPFHNKCGTWFFTASLTASQIQQLMGEKIGIKFIAPDAEMGDDMTISPGVQKRQGDRLFAHKQLRVQKRVRPDFIHVELQAPLYKTWISTAPYVSNPDEKFAYFDSAGSGATVYWIDHQIYLPNSDLTGYLMAEHRLVAEGISRENDEWNRIPIRDHGGCMLSLIGGSQHGVIPLNSERGDGARLKIVKTNPVVSSFLSGIGAIITELELLTERNEQVSTYTVIGTALSVPQSRFGLMLQLEAAVLFKILTSQYQAVVVVSSGIRNNRPANEDVWPATFAQYSDIPIIVASGVHYYRGSVRRSPFLTLNAPSLGICRHFNNDAIINGLSPAVAITTALATDMLTRPKVRNKLFIDNPALAPDEEKLLALRPVSAKIRDYLDSLAYDHGFTGFRSLWNGLNPDVTDINQYSA